MPGIIFQVASRHSQSHKQPLKTHKLHGLKGTHMLYLLGTIYPNQILDKIIVFRIEQIAINHLIYKKLLYS